MKFTDDELMFLIQSGQNATIKGKDAALVAELLGRLIKLFQTRQEKASAKQGD